MSFKEHLWKKVVPTYFMVVTFINIGMLTAGLTFFKEVRFGYEVFLSPLFFGFIGCIPLVLDYLFQEKRANQRAIMMQISFEFVLLEACILGVAKLIGIIDSPLTAVIMACMILVIFVIVSVFEYLQDQALCKKMNMALLQRRIQNQNENE